MVLVSPSVECLADSDCGASVFGGIQQENDSRLASDSSWNVERCMGENCRMYGSGDYSVFGSYLSLVWHHCRCLWLGRTYRQCRDD